MLSVISRLLAKLMTFPGHLKRFKEDTISTKTKTRNLAEFLEKVHSRQEKEKVTRADSFTKKSIVK